MGDTKDTGVDSRKIISQEVLESLAQGDHNAFRVVFKVAYPKVYAFAMGFIKNVDDAKDIAQTVFIRLWTKREMLTSVKNFDTYLYVVTKNAVLNYLASIRAYYVDISEAREVTSDMVSPVERMEAADLKLLVEMVVSKMPTQRQAVYRMSREEGMTNEEIATRLGLKKKTVENHLNLALNEIRNAMKFYVFIVSVLGVNDSMAVFI